MEPREWRTRRKKEAMESGVPEQDDRPRDGNRIKTRLLLGHEKTEQAKPILFNEWATAYLEIESVKTLRSYQDRLEIMER